MSLTKVTLEDLGDDRSVGESHRLEGLGVLWVSMRANLARPTYRSWDIGTGDSLWGRVKEVESGGLADLCDDLGSDTEC